MGALRGREPWEGGVPTENPIRGEEGEDDLDERGGGPGGGGGGGGRKEEERGTSMNRRKDTYTYRMCKKHLRSGHSN